jgi:hypothetical protein
MKLDKRTTLFCWNIYQLSMNSLYVIVLQIYCTSLNYIVIFAKLKKNVHFTEVNIFSYAVDILVVVFCKYYVEMLHFFHRIKHI